MRCLLLHLMQDACFGCDDEGLLRALDRIAQERAGRPDEVGDGEQRGRDPLVDLREDERDQDGGKDEIGNFHGKGPKAGYKSDERRRGILVRGDHKIN